jgi:peptidyl-prolyl cis-trans isomerase A (cyclophilin A)
MTVRASMTLRLLAALSLASAVSAFCQATPVPTPAVPATNDLPDAPSPTQHIGPPIVPNGPTVVFDTTMGRLTCQFYAKEAPVAVANFIGLAQGTREWLDDATQQKKRTKFFDGLIFHRVIPDFMIQGGDPAGTGAGDPGYFFQDEIDPGLNFDVPGRLAMANAGAGPTGGGTNGSQFFITEVPVPHLNGKHTIFGQCDDASVAVEKAIARVDHDDNDKPRTPVVMTKVTIVPEGQPLPALPAQPAPAPARPAMPPPLPH